MKNELPPTQANSTSSTEDEDDLSLDDEPKETVEPKSTSNFVAPAKTAKSTITKKKEEEEEEEKDPRKRFGWKPPQKIRKRKDAILPVILALKKISRSGKVRIAFNQKLKIPKKFRKRQKRKLNVIQPSKGSNNIFNISMKNKEGEIHSFKHDITGWDADGIDIQLDFDSPIEISA